MPDRRGTHAFQPSGIEIYLLDGGGLFVQSVADILITVQFLRIDQRQQHAEQRCDPEAGGGGHVAHGLRIMMAIRAVPGRKQPADKPIGAQRKQDSAANPKQHQGEVSQISHSATIMQG